MNAYTNNLSVKWLVLIVLAALPGPLLLADDLTPAPYRGDPLSVYGHWQLIPGTNILDLTGQNWVDDNDPTTPYSLSPVPFSPQILPTTAGAYELQLPNWIDNLPIKHMRVQLTWLNTLAPPLSVTSLALDNATPVTGQITFVSPLQVDAANIKAYQYYDFIFKPNPDFERVQVVFQPNAVLSQVVVDTVSTVPEPATLALLGLGGLGVLGRHRNR